MEVYVLDRREQLLSILSSEGNGGLLLSSAMLSQSIDGIDTLEIEVPISELGSNTLKEENYLLFQDLKGVWNFFVIKEVSEIHTEDEHLISVVSEQSAQELLDYECSYEMKGKDLKPVEYLEYLLAGTRWKQGNVDDVVAKKIVDKKTKGKTVLYALNTLLETYGMEIQYRIEVDGNKIVNRFIDIKKQVGEKTGKRIEFEKNAEKIKRTVSTAELKTAMIGVGGSPEKEEDNGGNGGGGTTTPTTKKEYVNLKPTVSAWRVYKTSVSPTAGNESGYLNPKKFGGLSYLIKSKPQTDVYSINTQDFGYVNIRVPKDNDSSFTDSPVYKNNTPYSLREAEEEKEPPIDLIDLEWTSDDGLATTKKGQNFIEVKSATDEWGYRMADGTLQARIGWFTNSNITDVDTLAKETYAYLKKFIKPRVSYEIEAKDLYALTGDSDYFAEHIQIGDTIAVIDKEFSKPLALEVRVVEKKSDLLKPENTSYTLGDEFNDLTNVDTYIGDVKVQGSDIENIGGNSDLQNMASNIINTAKLYADEINADKINVEVLNAELGKVNTLISEKASIGQLEVVNGSIENLYSTVATIDSAVIGKADISELRTLEAKIGEAEIDIADINKAVINKADITELRTLEAKIDTAEINIANIDKAVIGKADIGTVTALDGRIEQLSSDVAYIEDLSALEIRTETLESGYAKIDTLETEVAKIDKLETKVAKIDTLETKVAEIDTLSVKVAKIDKIEAEVGKIKTLETEVAKIKTLETEVAKIGTLEVKVGKIDQLEAKVGKIDKLESDLITTNSLVANKITASEVNGLIANFDKILAGKIVSNELTAAVGRFKAIEVQTAKIGQLESEVAKIGNLEAQVGKFGSLVAVDGTISGLHISKGTLTEAQINSATILDGFIKNLSASKITSGTLDASKITVKNLKADSITTGSITVEGNNLVHGSDFNDLSKWTLGNWEIDKTVKCEGITSVKLDINQTNSSSFYLRNNENFDTSDGEVFVGSCYIRTPNKDAIKGNGAWVEFTITKADGTTTYSYQYFKPTSNNVWERIVYSAKMPVGATKFKVDFGFNGNAVVMYIAKPMLSRGTIASVWKLHADELISDGAIDNNKLGDGAVTTDKLNIEELFVSGNAFVNNLQAVELKASQITTGKISSERLDISGLVSFDNMDLDMKDKFIFDTSQDKTFINGGALYTNSVSAEKINAKGLSVQNNSGATTFNIDKDGEVSVTGTIQSTVFDENNGYQITPDGSAVFNNALIRGDLSLPSAGITNFGDKVGNPNIVLGTSVAKVITGNNTTNQRVALGILEDGTSISGKKITVRAKYKVTPDSTGTFKIQTSGSHWSQIGNIITPTNNKLTGEIVATTTVNVPSDKKVSSFEVRLDNFVGTLEISEFKVEFGGECTAWKPHISEDVNLVRFWAGSDYEGRDKAPFQVFQDGTVKATKGEFNGTWTGKIKVGNILIEDTDSTQGIMAIKDNNDLNSIVELNETKSFINTDFALGNPENPEVLYDKEAKQVSFRGADVTISKSNSTVSLPNTETQIDLYYKGTYGNYNQRLKQNGGTLLFENIGDVKDGNVDFHFKKGTGNTSVKVSGDIIIDNSLKMGSIQMINRSTSTEKRLDFVVL